MKTCIEIKKYAPSKLCNVWKVKSGGDYYLITPSHCAIYKKANIWTFSKFLLEYSNLDWMVTKNYVSNQNPENDICWARISPSEHAIELKNEAIDCPINASFFFRQPYHHTGKLISNSSFASLNAVVYPSPESYLLEALDVGFRGMSGAACFMENNLKFIGIFVRRGAALGLKEGAKYPSKKFTANDSAINHKEKNTFYLKEKEDSNRKEILLSSYSSLRRHESSFKEKEEPILKVLREVEKMTTKLSTLESDIRNRFDRLENKVESLGNKVESLGNKVESLENKVESLEEKTLKKSDLDNLLNIVALRRGLILPSSIIFDRINNSECISIKSLL